MKVTDMHRGPGSRTGSSVHALGYLRVQIDPSGPVRLIGELDVFSAALLGRALQPWLLTGRPVQLDLSGLDFIDAAGIRELIEIRDRLGGSLSVVAASRVVRRFLQLTGLTELFGINEPGDPDMPSRPTATCPLQS